MSILYVGHYYSCIILKLIFFFIKNHHAESVRFIVCRISIGNENLNEKLLTRFYTCSNSLAFADLKYKFYAEFATDAVKFTSSILQECHIFNNCFHMQIYYFSAIFSYI